MAKRVTIIRKKPDPTRDQILKNMERDVPAPEGLTENAKSRVMNNVLDSVIRLNTTTSLMRESLLNKLIDDRRDIDNECGYPKTLTPEQYRIMYDREGIATRVVNIFPEESWVMDPILYETEDPDKTPFEEAWEDLEERFQLYSYMERIDKLSGIGRFGVILLGLNDGKDLSEPVEGINENGEAVGKPQYELLYLRTFDEQYVSIEQAEKDVTNPRYGQPVLYNINFENIAASRDAQTGDVNFASKEKKIVHWTRIIHVADNRETSEVYGTPRMQCLFNRLYDLRKIVGGSGEMFWKGAFPGYHFSLDPQANTLTSTQEDDFTDTIAEYANGLQRYIVSQGFNLDSLEPQVSDPKSHVETQLEIIAIATGVPKRIFMGSEQAKLASTKDLESWNKRIDRRRRKYVEPFIIRKMVDRFIIYGILPEIGEDSYSLDWPDLSAPSDLDKAEVLKVRTEAFAKYIGGNVDMLIPQEIYLTMFTDLEPDQVKEIMKAVENEQKKLEAEEEEIRKQMKEEEALNPNNPRKEEDEEEDIND